MHSNNQITILFLPFFNFYCSALTIFSFIPPFFCHFEILFSLIPVGFHVFTFLYCFFIQRSHYHSNFVQRITPLAPHPPTEHALALCPPLRHYIRRLRLSAPTAGNICIVVIFGLPIAEPVRLRWVSCW